MFDVGLLGPVRVRWSERDVDLGGSQSRTVLATCALDPGNVISVDTLVDRLWGGRPPRSALAQVHNKISRLRRRLADAGATGAGLVETNAGGYVFGLAPEAVDVHRFTAHAEQARSAVRQRRYDTAIRHFDTALALWRGDALGGTSPELTARALHLAQERAAVREERLDLLARTRGAHHVVAELERFVIDEPDRETAHSRFMAALFLSGRRCDALAHYRGAYRRWVEEFGVEPGAALRDLHEECLADNTEGVARFVPGWSTATDDRVVAVSPPRVVRGLPRRGAPLVARSEELREAVRLLREAPGLPLVVCGMPGIGKTSLATWAAHEVAGDFPDGQLHADLRGSTARPTEPVDVLRRFLAAVRPDRTPPRSPEECVSEYRTETAGRRLLVVLDDVRATAQIRDLLPSGDECAVVVTSRHRLLGLGPVGRVCLRPVPLSAAVDVLSGADPAVDAETVRRLADACAGLPLALSVVAPQVRAAAARTSLATLTAEDVSVAAAFGSALDGLDHSALALLGDIAHGRVAVPPPPGAALEALLDAHLVDADFSCHPVIAELC